MALGHEVVLLGEDAPEIWRRELSEMGGVKYRQYFVSRNGLNPLDDVRTRRELRRLIAEIQPDKSFIFTAKAISYAPAVLKRLGFDDFYILVAGLGSVFRGEGLKARLVSVVLSALYRRSFGMSRRVIFQNHDDRDFMVNRGLVNKIKTAVVNGSGVPLEDFPLSPLPEKPSFVFVGRLLRDKGIVEYLSVCRRIKQEYGDSVRLMLVGDVDSNPTSITKDYLQAYVDRGDVEFFGWQKDVRPYLRQASVFVLPSHHEGTPRCVLEAMSMGRAIITTDAPGCRETTKDGKNGYLIPVSDEKRLYDAMIDCIEHPETVALMGKRSREIAEQKYDVNIVNDSMLKIMGL